MTNKQRKSFRAAFALTEQHMRGLAANRVAKRRQLAHGAVFVFERRAFVVIRPQAKPHEVLTRPAYSFEIEQVFGGQVA